MTSAPSPTPKPGAVLALEISVATVLLAVDDLIDKAREIASPLSEQWTDVALTIRQSLDRALAGHEREYAPWQRGARSHIAGD